MAGSPGAKAAADAAAASGGAVADVVRDFVAAAGAPFPASPLPPRNNSDGFGDFLTLTMRATPERRAPRLSSEVEEDDTATAADAAAAAESVFSGEMSADQSVRRSEGSALGSGGSAVLIDGVIVRERTSSDLGIQSLCGPPSPATPTHSTPTPASSLPVSPLSGGGSALAAARRRLSVASTALLERAAAAADVRPSAPRSALSLPRAVAAARASLEPRPVPPRAVSGWLTAIDPAAEATFVRGTRSTDGLRGGGSVGGPLREPLAPVQRRSTFDGDEEEDGEEELRAHLAVRLRTASVRAVAGGARPVARALRASPAARVGARERQSSEEVQKRQ